MIHRNSDVRLRALERTARETATRADLMAWWRGMKQAGYTNERAAESMLELLRGLFLADPEQIQFDQRGRNEILEAFRRVELAAPDTDDTYCATNDCDDPSCHRCFSREGCGLHQKCREDAARGETAFVERDSAVDAMRWLILQRALSDTGGGWCGPELPDLGHGSRWDIRHLWLYWATNDAMENADEVSENRARDVVGRLSMAVDAAWDLDYPAAVGFVSEANDLLDHAEDDAFVCSRCERTAYDYGRYRCGECGERFCNRCEGEGGSHGGAHSCYGRCVTPGCYNELERAGESDYCAECQRRGAVENPRYWGRAGSGLMLFSPNGKKVLLALRSDEVLEPGTWGIPGGAVDGDDLYESALRETGEELGPIPPHEVFGEVMFQDGDFRYTTFLARLADSAKEWSPDVDDLNWENDEARWFRIDRLPAPLHFGVEHIVRERPDLFSSSSS